MAKKKPVQREYVSAEFVEDGGLAYAVDRTANGRYSVRGGGDRRGEVHVGRERGSCSDQEG